MESRIDHFLNYPFMDSINRYMKQIVCVKGKVPFDAKCMDETEIPA
jgi:hypothetical protein